jgi:hypothetical protein
MTGMLAKNPFEQRSQLVFSSGTTIPPKDLNSYINLYNNMVPKSDKRTIMHYPQLDTVLMVEHFIRDHSGEYKKRSLWEHLPKKVMYQTFCVIFDYLETSCKIVRDKEGKIGWIWDPEGVKKYLGREDLMWKNTRK